MEYIIINPQQTSFPSEISENTRQITIRWFSGGNKHPVCAAALQEQLEKLGFTVIPKKRIYTVYVMTATR